MTELIYLREELAAYAHEAWSKGVLELLDKCQMNEDGTLTVPEKLREETQRLAMTAYIDLPEGIMKREYGEAADKIVTRIWESGSGHIVGYEAMESAED